MLMFLSHETNLQPNDTWREKHLQRSHNNGHLSNITVSGDDNNSTTHRNRKNAHIASQSADASDSVDSNLRERDGINDAGDDIVDRVTNKRPRGELAYVPVKKEGFNFSCSLLHTLPPGVEPVPFDDRLLEKNATHLTCSMGCQNVTIPKDIPSFVIIGAQKGGTSALYHFFHHHPAVLSSSTFEPHFFDMRRKYKRFRFGQERLCHMRYLYLQRNFNLTEYYSRAAQVYPAPLHTFEKSPAYIRSPGAPFNLYISYPNIKLLAILRNPVTRAYSEYQMEYLRIGGQPGKMADSFNMMVQKSVESLRAANLSVSPTLEEFIESKSSSRHLADLSFSLPDVSFQNSLRIVDKTFTWQSSKKRKKMVHNTLYSGMYALHLSQWLEYFELGKSLMVVQFEKLLANKTGVFAEICDFLGVPRINLNESVLEQDYRPIKLNATWNETEVNTVDPLFNETREYLEHFFRPFNDELASLLGDEWKNVWFD